MKHLVDDLLILARADAGRLELHRMRLDLAEVVREALSLLEPLAAERNIHLSTQLQTAWVNGDAVRLSQFVTNLVTNSIRFSRSEADVFVSVCTRDGRAWLVVADTGIGIAAADQSHVFERFYQTDSARTYRAGQGTGLGLRIVLEIITAHEGTVAVTSKPDRGTTVTVQLPNSTV